MHKIATYFSRIRKECLSGLLFLSIFYLLGYIFLDPIDFFARDDGIITMSHAKNLIDYGFIGVSPSGERVSGASSPVQFMIYSAIYFIFKIDPFAYTLIQTIISTFFLGYLFYKFFNSKKLALLYTAVCAFGLTRIYTFLGWHASGMENALIHILFLWVIYILYDYVKTEKINYYYSLIIFMATIVRYDSVYHIAPLLIIFTIFWLIKYKSLAAFKLSVMVGLMWGIFFVAHYIYFGSIFPHTSLAQNINIMNNIHNLLSLNTNYMRALFSSIVHIIIRNGVILLFIFFMTIFLFDRKTIATESKFIYIICYSLLITGISNPLIFGPTRIDPARTTTFLALIVLLIICMGISNLIFSKVTFYTSISLILTCIIFAIYSIVFPPYYLGWQTSFFDDTRQQFFSAANDNDIHRATVSNPDLGILSWYKQFNVVDLGMIGSPLMATIKHDERMVRYYFNFIAPDMIETHGNWSIKYSFLWKSDAFKELYEPLNIITYYNNDVNHPQGVWIRKDILRNSNSEERLFYDRLLENLTLENIEQEFKNLQNTGDNNSAYISRTIYKFIPELIETGIYYQTIELFNKYNASKFDYFLITCRSDATAWKNLTESFNSYQEP